MIGERTVVNGCYILRERIGEDEFSEWWRASAIFVASNFLIRFIKPRYAADEGIIRAFIESGRVRAQVVSPAVAEVLEIDRFESRYFVASGYGAGRRLADALATGRKFSIEHACRLAMELAEGVDAFHQRDLMFESLNPECISIRESAGSIEEIKLLSPGYGRLMRLIPEDDDGAFRDYWAYAAPELKRDAPSDRRTDIYSLGAVLYRLLSGKLPYGSKAGARVRSKSASPAHVAASLARRGMPRELTTIVVRALRKRPSMRYDAAIDFIGELRAVLDSRRSAYMSAGAPDPIADLASLNLKQQRADAREIVRSLETSDYFRLLRIGGAAEIADMSAPAFSAPADEDIGELEEIEDEDDDESVPTEAYVDAGYAAIRRGTAAASADRRPTMVAVPMAATQVSGEAAARDGASMERARRAPRSSSALRWTATGGSAEDVAAAMLLAAELASAGAGTVKFIEEPAGEAARVIGKVITTLAERTLLLDIGSLPKGASLETIREAIGRLAGLAGNVPTMPDGPSEEGDAERGSERRVAKEVMSLASGRRPLILLARSVERVAPSAYRFMLEFAEMAIESNACGFFFYGQEAPPRWHILSSTRG